MCLFVNSHFAKIGLYFLLCKKMKKKMCFRLNFLCFYLVVSYIITIFATEK